MPSHHAHGRNNLAVQSRLNGDFASNRHMALNTPPASSSALTPCQHPFQIHPAIDLAAIIITHTWTFLIYPNEWARNWADLLGKHPIAQLRSATDRQTLCELCLCEERLIKHCTCKVHTSACSPMNPFAMVESCLDQQCQVQLPLTRLVADAISGHTVNLIRSHKAAQWHIAWPQNHVPTRCATLVIGSIQEPGMKRWDFQTV